MAATNLSASITFRAPEFTKNHHKAVIYPPKRIPISICCATSSATTKKPEIELEFIGPKPDENGKYPMDKTKAVSGEKLLRNIMSENNIKLYAAYGKVMNCGGGGSCGTCIVEIIDGKDLLNERTNTELRYLKKLCRNLSHGDWLAKL
ncbi:photosynthetic NDH subunit of subcomplex B 3, chloroplastic isoform X2 [Solanum dulcamara]|uniref:photosynthetic NDH subunit of subcomplex B 3, chloroplastic isoform X2 n=1 Tax=Solanum dulcamara TaxID=45834 RepID=UPI0024853379|nr:photosynthetic NDH subunit of subcomplex B 3, chloroplastic isoform X2 [Solanum dulcamara]